MLVERLQAPHVSVPIRYTGPDETPDQSTGRREALESGKSAARS